MLWFLLAQASQPESGPHRSGGHLP
jgi:hypothetical protein